MRTTNDSGGLRDPYLAGWAVGWSSDPSSVTLATDEGLRVGDTVDDIHRIYPDAVSSGPWLTDFLEWWALDAAAVVQSR